MPKFVALLKDKRQGTLDDGLLKAHIELLQSLHNSVPWPIEGEDETGRNREARQKLVGVGGLHFRCSTAKRVWSFRLHLGTMEGLRYF